MPPSIPADVLCSRAGHEGRGNYFFVPSHGGIWTLCHDLEEHEVQQLRQYGFPRRTKCISYLDESSEYARAEEMKNEIGHGEYAPGRRPSLSESRISPPPMPRSIPILSQECKICRSRARWSA